MDAKFRLFCELRRLESPSTCRRNAWPVRIQLACICRPFMECSAEHTTYMLNCTCCEKKKSISETFSPMQLESPNGPLCRLTNLDDLECQPTNQPTTLPTVFTRSHYHDRPEFFIFGSEFEIERGVITPHGEKNRTFQENERRELLNNLPVVCLHAARSRHRRAFSASTVRNLNFGSYPTIVFVAASPGVQHGTTWYNMRRATTIIIHLHSGLLH
jgi:hypothetical protein